MPSHSWLDAICLPSLHVYESLPASADVLPQFNSSSFCGQFCFESHSAELGMTRSEFAQW